LGRKIRDSSLAYGEFRLVLEQSDGMTAIEFSTEHFEFFSDCFINRLLEKQDYEK